MSPGKWNIYTGKPWWTKLMMIMMINLVNYFSYIRPDVVPECHMNPMHRIAMGLNLTTTWLSWKRTRYIQKEGKRRNVYKSLFPRIVNSLYQRHIYSLHFTDNKVEKILTLMTDSLTDFTTRTVYYYFFPQPHPSPYTTDWPCNTLGCSALCKIH